ncbi:MAG: DAK2 domain-containing protein, partial [Clostridia bacterium]|nr:DAK2 domain-containing protein [Clostridia bacterium]
ILSQIFKGFCDYVADKNEIQTKDFAAALIQAAKVAYSAVTKPKEGTILTVIRVIAEESGSFATNRNSFDKFLVSLITVGEDILARTPDKLPVLKKAGVVDAGGMGLMCIIRGFLKVLNNEEIIVSIQPVEQEIAFEGDIESLEDIEYAYCTEYFVINLNDRATTADIDKLRDKLSTVGDSLVVIGDLQMVKVHVHTNVPGKALQYGLEMGELGAVKIENMLEQNRLMRAKLDAERKPIGIVSVCAGSGFAAMFKELSVDYIIEGGQTMNPSVDDILQAIKKVNAQHIIILPNNKNIILAAEQAKELTEKNCIVLHTKNVAAGIAASIRFDPEAAIEENIANMREGFSSLIAGYVTTAVRSTTIDGLKLKEGDKIGLSDSKILTKGEAVDETLIDLIGKLKEEGKEMLTLYYGSDVTEEDCNAVVAKINEIYPDLEVAAYMGGQPHYYYVIALE